MRQVTGLNTFLNKSLTAAVVQLLFCHCWWQFDKSVIFWQ